MRVATMALFLAAHLTAVHNAAAFEPRGQAEEFPRDFTRVLIPVTATAVPGANGSVWTTEWTMFNGSGRKFYVIGPFPYRSLSPPVQDNDIAAGETKRLVLSEAFSGFDGAFVYLPTADLETLPMSLRVRDISVMAQSYGTSIPIVRPDDFKSKLRLVDVPTDGAYRAMVRIYNETPEGQLVHVAIYATQTANPIEEYDITLRVNDHLGIDGWPRPAYAQLNLLSDRVRNAGPKMRVEVSASNPAARIWAFVSISHNESQQVTTIVP